MAVYETYKQKIEKLKKFTNQTLQEVFETKKSYKKFLDFQARLYKYRFEDSLLIYAQNPNARACATYEQWNKKKVGRRIYRNPKTIHVFADDRESQIKYLFELSDTHGKAFRYPNKITIPTEYQLSIAFQFCSFMAFKKCMFMAE